MTNVLFVITRTATGFEVRMLQDVFWLFFGMAISMAILAGAIGGRKR